MSNLSRRTSFSSKKELTDYFKKTGLDTQNLKIVSSNRFALVMGHNGDKIYHPYNINEWEGGFKGAYEAFLNKRKILESLKPKKVWTRKNGDHSKDCQKKVKGSTGIPGICKKIETDNRTGNKSLRYEVHYNDSNGESKRKKFSLSMNKYSTENELHSFFTAKIFRHHYEFCNENGLNFDPKIYSNWKNETLYDKGLSGIIEKYHSDNYEVR